LIICLSKNELLYLDFGKFIKRADRRKKSNILAQ
jgi:hypothetical protein